VLPGGNITGVSNLGSDLGGKWVELLKEFVSCTVRVVRLFNPAPAAPLKFFLPSVQAAASSFAVCEFRRLDQLW
jgi:hypothetical protein